MNQVFDLLPFLNKENQFISKIKQNKYLEFLFKERKLIFDIKLKLYFFMFINIIKLDWIK